jgi:hypothetical protein
VESYAVGIPPTICLPTTLASAPTTTPTSVDANGSTVWFTSITDVGTSPGLVSVPRSGGASTTLVSGTHRHWFNSVLVTPSYVYWLEQGFGASIAALYRKPLVGGARTLVRIGGIDRQRHALAYAGGYVYFADSSADSVIWKIDAAAVSTRLWSALGHGDIYPDCIAVAGSTAYFLRDTGSPLQSVPLAGGEPTLLASRSGGTINALATDGTNVYWAVDGSPGTIFKLPVGGGSAATFASVGGVVTGLSIYGADLYFTVQSPGKVGRIALNGVFASERTVASSEDNPSSLFVDSYGVLHTPYASSCADFGGCHGSSSCYSRLRFVKEAARAAGQ